MRVTATLHAITETSSDPAMTPRKSPFFLHHRVTQFLLLKFVREKRSYCIFQSVIIQVLALDKIMELSLFPLAKAIFLYYISELSILNLVPPWSVSSSAPEPFERGSIIIAPPDIIRTLVPIAVPALVTAEVVVNPAAVVLDTAPPSKSARFVCYPTVRSLS
jgi:hypothetical protein